MPDVTSKVKNPIGREVIKPTLEEIALRLTHVRIMEAAAWLQRHSGFTRSGPTAIIITGFIAGQGIIQGQYPILPILVAMGSKAVCHEADLADRVIVQVADP